MGVSEARSSEGKADCAPASGPESEMTGIPYGESYKRVAGDQAPNVRIREK